MLSEGVARLWPVERRDMGRAGGRHWVREVVLRVEGMPVVFARSITPFRATCGAWRAVRQLGTRPLAQLLFDDPSVARSALRGELHRRGGMCRRRANNAWRSIGCGAWRSAIVRGRSSVFVRGGMPLRVFEAFAPEGIRALGTCPRTSGLRTAVRSKLGVGRLTHRS
jgi:chorismate--pyruvate lyase